MTELRSRNSKKKIPNWKFVPIPPLTGNKSYVHTPVKAASFSVDLLCRSSIRKRRTWLLLRANRISLRAKSRKLFAGERCRACVWHRISTRIGHLSQCPVEGSVRSVIRAKSIDLSGRELFREATIEFSCSDDKQHASIVSGEENRRMSTTTSAFNLKHTGGFAQRHFL